MSERRSKQEEAKFVELFWAAREEHVELGKEASAEGEKHKAALSFAVEHAMEWGELLLDVSLSSQQGEGEDALKKLVSKWNVIPSSQRGLGYFVKGAVLHKVDCVDEAIEAYRKALECSKYNTRGNAWNNLGKAYSDKGEYDEAIKAYGKALADAKFDTPGKAWFSMGIAYRAKGEYDKAIEAYGKALDDPKYDTPCKAWNNLGNAYSDKGEYDEAIKAYGKALADAKFDTPGMAWNNLGVAYSEKGEHDKAIKAYRKALDDPKYDTPGKVWNNLGITYSDKGEHDKAIKAYRKAVADANYKRPANALASLGSTYLEISKNKDAREVLNEALQKCEKGSSDYARAQRLLSLVESNLKPEAMSSDDRGALEHPATTGREGPEKRLLAKIREIQESEYEKYLDKKNSTRDNVLSILRGWSSAVTLLEGSEGLWRGGGYFIKWRGKGIVIDPGFDFLRNFHDAKYHGREIDAVLVTHNHTDHNADVRAIDDLRYELYKRRERDPHGKIDPYLLMWDKDSGDKIKLQVEKPEHRHHPITFDIGRCSPMHTIRQQRGLPFGVKYFAVRHDKGNIEDPVGFKLVLKDGTKNALTIGFTGDTEYFDDLGKHLGKCDILIGHISQPKAKELTDVKHRNKNHLGYNGLVELIKAAKPKLTLVGEFWAGLGDIRIDLVQCLRKQTKCEEIFPAGLGLHMVLPGLEIECTNCGKAIAFADIRVGPPTEQFGNLSYLCEDCCLA